MSLQKLYCAFVLYRHNCQVLHWKVTGLDFDTVHELMNTYIDFMHDNIDKVAEMILIMGQNPLCLMDTMKMIESDEHQFVIVHTEQSYAAKEVFDYVKYMCESLLSICDEVTNEPGMPSGIISEIDSIKYWLMVEGVYKHSRRFGFIAEIPVVDPAEQGEDLELKESKESTEEDEELTIDDFNL